MPAVAARGGAGHRAKPVLNALLNFTKLRRAVNHLGGSTRLGCCSCRIWLAQVPAEFLRWDLPADPSPPPPIVLRITYYPNPDTRFNPSSLSFLPETCLLPCISFSFVSTRISMLIVSDVRFSPPPAQSGTKRSWRFLAIRCRGIGYVATNQVVLEEEGVVRKTLGRFKKGWNLSVSRSVMKRRNEILPP